MIKASVKLDTSRGDRLEKQVVNGLDPTTREIADAIIEDIKAHWSPVSPSNVGEAPAKVSGTLERSLRREKTGRSITGRFASAQDAAVYVLEAGASYAGLLESESGLFRPFFEPALERASFVYELAYRKLLS